MLIMGIMVHLGDPLNVNRQPDGSLMLTPKGRVIGKSEQGHADDAEVRSEPETQPTPGAEATGEADDTLDQFAKAAVDAFRKRKAQKQAVLRRPAAKKGIVEVEKKHKKPAAKMKPAFRPYKYSEKSCVKWKAQ